MLYNSVYIKGPEKANLWIRKAHEWLPGVGAGVGDGQGVTANGHKGGLFRGGGIVLKLGGECCTTW